MNLCAKKRRETPEQTQKNAKNLLDIPVDCLFYLSNFFSTSSSLYSLILVNRYVHNLFCKNSTFSCENINFPINPKVLKLLSDKCMEGKKMRYRYVKKVKFHLSKNKEEEYSFVDLLKIGVSVCERFFPDLHTVDIVSLQVHFEKLTREGHTKPINTIKEIDNAIEFYMKSISRLKKVKTLRLCDMSVEEFAKMKFTNRGVTRVEFFVSDYIGHKSVGIFGYVQELFKDLKELLVMEYEGWNTLSRWALLASNIYKQLSVQKTTPLRMLDFRRSFYGMCTGSFMKAENLVPVLDFFRKQNPLAMCCCKGRSMSPVSPQTCIVVPFIHDPSIVRVVLRCEECRKCRTCGKLLTIEDINRVVECPCCPPKRAREYVRHREVFRHCADCRFSCDACGANVCPKCAAKPENRCFVCNVNIAHLSCAWCSKLICCGKNQNQEAQATEGKIPCVVPCQVPGCNERVCGECISECPECCLDVCAFCVMESSSDVCVVCDNNQGNLFADVDVEDSKVVLL